MVTMYSMVKPRKFKLTASKRRRDHQFKSGVHHVIRSESRSKPLSTPASGFSNLEQVPTSQPYQKVATLLTLCGSKLSNGAEEDHDDASITFALINLIPASQQPARASRVSSISVLWQRACSDSIQVRIPVLSFTSWSHRVQLSAPLPTPFLSSAAGR